MNMAHLRRNFMLGCFQLLGQFLNDDVQFVQLFLCLTAQQIRKQTHTQAYTT